MAVEYVAIEELQSCLARLGGGKNDFEETRRLESCYRVLAEGDRLDTAELLKSQFEILSGDILADVGDVQI